ncbi:NHLP leader peptide family RiPP precursor [Polaribacter cellanae]|uniref:NHLP leader peptide family RiPP n=1 Tax=Polaribacter cellanae TaxID=2818493 RepID=A0A975H7A5_9FLAO|nr:NHLP leader peptide family RiPP precursor [Polaribacter cellanae]QTE23311.1 NHLP leader peptide family RiPP precursor [Polaribacter cellanae]
MSLEQSQENAQKNLNKLINKCWEDENFKKELIENPVETMETFYGRTLDSNKKSKRKIVVNDQTDPSVVHINIPAKPNFDDMELSDAELEAVAGGWFVQLGWTLICFGDGDPGGTSVSVE